MKVKINKWLCPYGYVITLFGTIYVRNKNTYDRVIQCTYFINWLIIYKIFKVTIY